MLVIVPLLAIVLTVFLNHTKYGMAIRASAANPDAARLSSISPKKMSTLVWTIAGLLAALGMILTIPLTSSTATETITLGPGVLLRAIVAALIGGMVSMPRAVPGGVAIGITEALLFYNYPSQVGLLDGVLFVAVLVILLVTGGAIATPTTSTPGRSRRGSARCPRTSGISGSFGTCLGSAPRSPSSPRSSSHSS